MNLDDHDDWCLSGGAVGADLEWGHTAEAIGHGVIHFSFANARTSAPSQTLEILTAKELEAADFYCHRANRSLGRKFPSRSWHTTNLLRRDWYQVAAASSCYGVSTLGVPPGPTIPLGTVIAGNVKSGTAWAVQMFIDRHDGEACACYLFDQILCHWFQWHGDGWQCIYEAPKPLGVYAGIGARDLLPIGQIAIRVLMNYRGVRDKQSPTTGRTSGATAA